MILYLLTLKAVPTVNVSKNRLDKHLAENGLAVSRSQAENDIRLGLVQVNNKVVTKPGYLVNHSDTIKLTSQEQYVSRAGLKLASAATYLKLDFKDKVVLDVGSSTGGFTDYALQHGASKVIAVDVGTKQLHPSLQKDPRIELHEKTDIRNFKTDQNVDIVLVDVSFISLRGVLPVIARLMTTSSELVAMAKPQFEAGTLAKHKGVIKNEKLRREILKTLEEWIKNLFVIVDKADSGITGVKGNKERFYLLKKL